LAEAYLTVSGITPSTAKRSCICYRPLRYSSEDYQE
jgi:hypothetical protein